MNNILENSISNIDDDLIEMTAQKLMRTRPRKIALNIAKFAGIAAAAAALCIAVRVGITQYNDRVLNSTVSGSDPANSAAGDAVIMPLEDFVKLSDEQATELLRGFTYDELVLAWGGSMHVTSARIREGWKCGDKIVSVEFEPDGEKFVWYVRDVSIFDVEETHPLDFKAQCIRANVIKSKWLWINSRSELEDYFSNIDEYDLDTFREAVSIYDDAFFRDRCLLLFFNRENSGSNEINVEKVEYTLLKDTDTVTATVERIMPWLGTCDNEEWQIMIELDKSVSGSKLKIEYKNVELKSELDFKAQNIRTNLLQYDPAPSFPETVLIKDRGELEKYYADNSEKYNLKYDWNDTSFFHAVLGVYDEEFFKDHCLLFVIVQEGSGSIDHEVKKVEYSVENDMIIPTIERIEPNTGTCDMAEWHIVIELDARYGGAQSVEITENTLCIDVLTPEPDEPDPFFDKGGVTYADILEYGYEERLGFKVKNMEDQPDFQKYLPSSFYHTVYDIEYVFDDYSITACRYGEDFHPGLLNKENIEAYDYKGYTFYEHPANTQPDLIIFFDDNNIVYYSQFVAPGGKDAVRDRIIEIIN